MTASPSVLPLQLGGGGYQISRSVRLRSSASAYFSRLPSVTSNQKTFTWSGWVKRGAIGTESAFFGSADLASFGYNVFVARFTATNTIRIVQTDNIGGSIIQFDTTAVFRDPSAWYHIVFDIDTTQATNTNGVKLWVNGIQQTGTFAAYTQNTNCSVNSNGFTNYIGRYGIISPTAYLDGYVAEVNFIDGQALTPSSFGTTDSNGIWQPKAYTGTYGTNGFYLKFTDNSAATAAAIGKDYSGNGNNWTPNNISVTAGVTYDSMVDSPTVGYAASNYAVLNPLDVRGNSGTGTLTNGNLTATATGSTNGTGPTRGCSQYILSGNYYFEVTVSATSGTSYSLIGVRQDGSGSYGSSYCYLAIAASSTSAVITTSAGNVQTGLGFVAANDVIGVAIESAGWVTFYKNNTIIGVRQSFTVSSSLQPFVEPRVGDAGASLASFAVNFGQRPFTYTPPTGFAALNTYNLPAATINNGATVMAASTYTSNGTTQTITNNGNNAAAVSFKPDLVWTKARNSISNHVLNDSVRGAANYLVSNSTAAEATAATYLTSFDGSGYSIGAGNFFANSTTVVGWQWQAGQGTTSSNTNGSITSTVSVNQSAGFSIVTWTSTGSAATVGHGLGVAPKFIITKSRNAVQSWYVYHSAYGATQTTYLNLTDAAFTDSRVWNNTAPTSTVFSIGTIGPGAATTEVAYCWSEVAGYSKFGSYTGNGSADGPFVYCGFRPRWIMIKDTTNAGTSWAIYDTSRDTYNVAQNLLVPNNSNAEATLVNFDMLSNGFKLRSTSGGNTSGATYIYATFAENPLNISRAR